LALSKSNVANENLRAVFRRILSPQFSTALLCVCGRRCRRR